MDFNFHPKYRSIFREVKDFIYDKNLDYLDINLICGGDGTFFVYKSDKPNFLISSDEYSKGFYASSWFEGDFYQKDLIKYANNPKKFNHEIPSVQLKINGKKIPDLAINEVLINMDSMFKASVDGEKITETGFFVYTPLGCNAWAAKYGGIVYDTLGIVSMDKRLPCILNDSLKIEILKYHDLQAMIDGKGYNLDKNYEHCSTRDKSRIFTKPWSLKEGDILEISKGNPIKIAKMKTFI